MVKRWVSIVLWVVIGFGNGIAQSKPLAQVVQHIAVNTANAIFFAKAAYAKTIADSSALRQNLDTVKLQLYRQGYWGASLDTTIRKADSLFFYWYCGDRYDKLQLQKGNIDDNILAEVGLTNAYQLNKTFSPLEIDKVKEKITKYAENNGYPFANVYLSDIKVGFPSQNIVTARINCRKGQLFTFDTLRIESKTQWNKRYLSRYLGIKKGNIYIETQVQNITARLRELSYLAEKQPYIIEFIGQKARPVLFLQRKRASKFDFLLGFLPNNAITKKPLITGNVELDLQNLFGSGENVRLQYAQTRAESPELKLHLTIPYLLNLPFGADGNFELYKRDTSYLDIRADAGLRLLFTGNNYLKVFWAQTGTRLLEGGVDTVAIKNQRRLPALLDVLNNAFGVEYHVERLDYRFNPRKGYVANLRVSAGTKQVLPNLTITSLRDDNGFKFGSLYDSISKPSVQYRAHFKADYYIPLAQRSTLRCGATGGTIISSNQVLYRNELHRIGGAKLLRGFDEESIWASTFGVATLEYRFLIGQNSYLLAFADQGYYETLTNDTRIFGRPLGVGAGMSFETKAGIFALTLAFGRQNNDEFDFNAAKVHFGYVNLF